MRKRLMILLTLLFQVAYFGLLQTWELIVLKKQVITMLGEKLHRTSHCTMRQPIQTPMFLTYQGQNMMRLSLHLVVNVEYRRMMNF